MNAARRVGDSCAEEPLSGDVLSLDCLLLAGLLACGAAPVLAPRGGARVAGAAMAALCLAGAASSLAVLLTGAAPALTRLDLGLPGTAGMALGIDALSAFFLLTVFGTAAACALAEGPAAPLRPILVAGMALAVLAADGFALVLGFGLMAVAAWGLAAQHRSALRGMAVALAGLACLIGAVALLAQGDAAGLGFAAMRAAPPQGWVRGAVLALALLGTGLVLLPAAQEGASGAVARVALYALIRLVFDLCGAQAPLWCAALLLAAGAGLAVLGALRANLEPEMLGVLAAGTVADGGLVAVGLGLSLLGRAADLPALATLGLGAALLLVLVQAAVETLLWLGAGAAREAAGSGRLDRLGGLVHLMPLTTACMLVGAASLAALPPSAGFAGLWLLLQAAIAATRIGGIALPMLVAVVLALVGLAAALGASAAVRLIGVAFLGRPRVPRGAGAEEAPPTTRRVLIGLAGVVAVLGLLPGPTLDLAAPAIRALLGATPAWGGGLALALAPRGGGSLYSAPVTVLLLAACGGVGLWAVRRWAVPGERRAPPWENGFAAPPPWLPFGEPLTQYGGASFAHILRRSLGATLPGAAWLATPARRACARLSGRMRWLPLRGAVAVTLATLMALLAVVAGLGAP